MYGIPLNKKDQLKLGNNKCKIIKNVFKFQSYQWICLVIMVSKL